MPATFTPAPSPATGKENINNDAFYKVVTQGFYQGISFVNVFYYRVGLGLLPGGLNFGGAEALAYTFKNQVWTGNVRDIVPLDYTLQTITVYPYNGAFDPMYNMPFTLTVNEAGTAAGSPVSPAGCVIVKFNMEGATLGLNGWFPPKRGYMAFGPLREGDVDASGKFNATALSFYAANLAVLGQDLINATSLVTFWPIRISTRKIADVLTLRGFTDVNGITVNPVQKWRASREPEA